MTQPSQEFTVVFPEWYDELAEFEHEAKGYLSDVQVRFSDDQTYSLFFIDPIRLQQDFAASGQSGQHYYAEPNLVIVQVVRREQILKAIAELVGDGFFARLGATS